MLHGRLAGVMAKPRRLDLTARPRINGNMDGGWTHQKVLQNGLFGNIGILESGKSISRPAISRRQYAYFSSHIRDLRGHHLQLGSQHAFRPHSSAMRFTKCKRLEQKHRPSSRSSAKPGYRKSCPLQPPAHPADTRRDEQGLFSAAEIGSALRVAGKRIGLER